MSLANQILDIYDDVAGAQLQEILKNSPPGVDSKNEDFLSRTDLEKTAGDGFALRIMTKEGHALKKYPITSKVDTWLSGAYFEKNAHKLPANAQKIAASMLKTAYAKHGIKASDKIEKLASPTILVNLYREEYDFCKTASADSQLESAPEGAAFALPGRYPLYSPEFVKKAAAYFVDYFGQFDSDDRHVFAQNVLKQASGLGVDLTEQETKTLKKVAGDSYGDILGTQIKLRKEYVSNKPEAVETLDKIASAKEKLGPEKFASALSQFDKVAGLKKHYGKLLAEPYQAVYESRFEKEAGYTWEDESAGVSVTGKELVKAASDKYDKIKSYFGETLANSLKKHASEIFDSLPKDAKVIIARIAKGEA